jgi:hypothetical protein
MHQMLSHVLFLQFDMAFHDSIGSMDGTGWEFDPMGILPSILHPEEATIQFEGTMSNPIRNCGYITKYTRKAWAEGIPTTIATRAA